MAFTQPSRNLALELVRVTETAAIAASRWVGRGAKNDADQVAVDGMRKMKLRCYLMASRLAMEMVHQLMLR